MEEECCALSGCTKTSGLLKCSRCYRVRYCGAEHQRTDWNRHKAEDCLTEQETMEVQRTAFCVRALAAWIDEKRERREVGARFMQKHEYFGRTGVLYLRVTSAQKAEDLMDGKTDFDDDAIQLTFVEEKIDSGQWLLECNVQYDPAVNFAYTYRVALPLGGYKEIKGIAPRPDLDVAAAALVLNAAVFAAHVHRCKTRKSDGSAYICHPLEVAEILQQRCNITDWDVIAAAILHDTVEDHPEEASDKIIREKFGECVANIVAEVTDDRSLSQVERKRAQLEHVGTMSRGARLVKAADMLHNLSSMLSNPPEGWSEEKITGYAAWKKLIFNRGLRLLHPELERELTDVFASLLPREMIGEQLEERVEAYFAYLSAD